jgi:hypothetical protein
MHDLDRIEALLANKRIDSELFERFAQDALSEVYPGLSPIPGGTDWGRDADITSADAPVQRLMATTARTRDGVRANMLRGIASLQEHKVTHDVRPVLVSLAEVSVLDRQSLIKSAETRGVHLSANDIYDRRFVADRLRRDGYWRKELLGLPSTPISLLAATPESADSPWTTLSLVGRNQDVEALGAIGADVILSGPPGVGKSRVAGIVGGAVFVNPHVSTEQLANDLRWANPAVLVIDDAGSTGDLLHQLSQWRRTEPDVFRYRIIAVCWPDEVDQLATVLVDAERYQLDLLERGPMDQIVKEMGITGQLARGEILDQAEGRPGWAVSLGALLLQSNQFASLLDGKALLGEASAYLRRAGADLDDSEALARIAALGSVSETELGRLASTLGVSITKLSGSITRAATAGLIDVASRYSPEARRNLRLYQLRPPMLADTLVTERAFAATVPTLDLKSLADDWPDHLLPLTESAIDAARLGAAEARPVADQLFELLLAGEPAPDQFVEVSKKYATLDERAGDRVLLLCQAALEQLCASGSDNIAWANQNAVELAALIAGRYRSKAAVKFLLDSAVVDRRRQPQTPAHPLRRFSDLIHTFHPELRRPVDTRDFVAIALDDWWWETSSPGPVEQQVFADAAAALLSPRIEALFTDPGHPMQLMIYEGLVSIEEMHHILDDTWPRLRRVLASGSDIVATMVIDVVAGWLRVGGGYDKPFGKEHAPESIAAVKEIALHLCEDLGSVPQLSIGARLKLRHLLAQHDIEFDVEIPAGWEPLLQELEHGPGVDYADRERRLADDIAAVVLDWAAEEPELVVDRLLEIKRETTVAELNWPNRVWIAAASLAQNVKSPLRWLATALGRGLVPEVTAFLPRVLADGLATPEVVGLLFANGATRAETIGQCLLDGTPPLRSMAIDELDVQDFRIVETMYLRKQLDEDTSRALLTQPMPRVRGIIAIAMFAGQGGPYNASWSPGDLEGEWLAAVRELRSDEAAITDYDAAALLTYLAAHYPGDLCELVQASLDESADNAVYATFTPTSWSTLANLPPPERRKLLVHFKDRPVVMWLLRKHLIGWDLSWLEQLLDSGEMTPEEVLAGYNGLSGSPPLEPYARLLVPRGVAPERIAELRLSGIWTGEQSARYAALVAEFEAMRQSDDPHVQAVAAAGVQMYAERQHTALREEHQKRVRGDL